MGENMMGRGPGETAMPRPIPNLQVALEVIRESRQADQWAEGRRD